MTSTLCPQLHSLFSELQISSSALQDATKKFGTGNANATEIKSAQVQVKKAFQAYEKFCKTSAKIKNVNVWAPDVINLENFCLLNNFNIESGVSVSQKDLHPDTLRIMKLDIFLGSSDHSVHFEALSNLFELQELNLHGKLGKIPDISTLAKLTTLHLSGAKLTQFNSADGVYPNIREFDLSLNELDSIDGIASVFPNLSVLSLTSNGLKSIRGIGAFKMLTKLDLAANDITSGVDEIGLLTELKELRIDEPARETALLKVKKQLPGTEILVRAVGNIWRKF